jgi:hypothetical protein
MKTFFWLIIKNSNFAESALRIRDILKEEKNQMYRFDNRL